VVTVSGPGGLTIFITGLPGAGKTTLATALCTRLEAMDARPLHLLDGDVLRREISSDLGFTREDRDTHVRRIGQLAADLTAGGAIAICAVIAPYDQARRTVRARIDRAGDFRLVYVATPLEVCEQRDPKGLYALARAGKLSHFTGVSDPYETPIDAEIVVNTAGSAVADSVSQVVEALLATEALVRPVTPWRT
jgi:sulfate adenylyltransferase